MYGCTSRCSSAGGIAELTNREVPAVQQQLIRQQVYENQAEGRVVGHVYVRTDEALTPTIM